MTNNPTIDGVSRADLDLVLTYGCGTDASDAAWDRLRALLDAPSNDLREHCKRCAEVVKTWPEWKRNCLGGAPAVERQEPYGFASVLIDNFRFAIDNGKQPTFSKGDLLWLIEQLSKAQSESAALQSTIAQLEDKLNKAIDLDFQRRETIARLEARIAELEPDQFEGWSIDTTTGRPILVFKGCSVIEDVQAYQIIRMLKAIAELESGRGEPSEYRYRFTHRGETSKWFPVDSYNKLSAIGNDPAYEIQPLYAAPTAPVAVIRNAQRYEYLRERDLETIKHGGVFAGLTPDNLVLNGEDLDSAIDACLDATAALNGKAK